MWALVEQNRKIRLPVEVDDDGFTIDEQRLDESLNRRIEELAKQRFTNRNQKRREIIALSVSLCVLIICIGLCFTQAYLMGVALFAIFAMEIKGIVKWIEYEERS